MLELNLGPVYDTQTLYHCSRFANKSNFCILFVNMWLSVLFANYCPRSEALFSVHWLTLCCLSVGGEAVTKPLSLLSWSPVSLRCGPGLLDYKPSLKGWLHSGCFKGDIAHTVWGFLILAWVLKSDAGFEVVNPSKQGRTLLQETWQIISFREMAVICSLKMLRFSGKDVFSPMHK